MKKKNKFEFTFLEKKIKKIKKIFFLQPKFGSTTWLYGMARPHLPLLKPLCFGYFTFN